MTLFLAEADVAALVDVPETIDILERAFTRQPLGRATSLPRQRLASECVTLHMMAGAVEGYLGYKTFTPGAPAERPWSISTTRRPASWLR
jgi:ornithine cyclodeaminase/alanine dehydrogenase-like protein (mu-crystallin family)